ncbi:MAG: nucleotidyltransferase family protein [Gemmatimonadaceae bacterium]|nr:nucleotidyltransferase family protein [Gemmatimonadaceae bacterium]
MLAPLTTRSARALLSPSARVLVAAADPDGGIARVRELPWSDVHWPTLVSLTSFERAAAQVFRLLRAAPEGAVPDDVTNTMQRIFRVAVFRSDELSDAAGAACDALEHAGVAALWLKGAALAMQSAEAFSVRSMGDLDVLVDPAQHDTARRALLAAGWATGVPDPSYDVHHHDAPLFWRAGIRLELHDGLFPPGHPFADDSAESWIGRGVARLWGTRAVTVLPPAWHVVHASAHWAWNHEGEIGTWQYLHDLQRLTGPWGSAADEWHRVVQAAELINARQPVGWALWLGSRLGSASVDERAMQRLRGPSRMLTAVEEREWVLRAFHSPAASPSVAWSRFWWRRSMAGLGEAAGSWPWCAGRTAPASGLGGPLPTTSPLQRTDPQIERESDPGSELRAGTRSGTVARWRRHLDRVLRG